MDNKTSESLPIATVFKSNVPLFSNATFSSQQQIRPVFGGGGFGFGNLPAKTPSTSVVENAEQEQQQQTAQASSSQAKTAFSFIKSQFSNSPDKNTTSLWGSQFRNVEHASGERPKLFENSKLFGGQPKLLGKTNASPVRQPEQHQQQSQTVTSENSKETLFGKRRSSSTSRILDPAQLELCTSIKLANIPKVLNNKTFLKNHFQRFGEISKINCRLKTDIAIVEFVDHESAKNAKENGGQLRRNASPVKIFYVLPNSLAQNVNKQPDAMQSNIRPGVRSVVTSDIAKRFADRANRTRAVAQRPITATPQNASKNVHLERTGNILYEADNLQSIVSQLKSLIGQQAVSAHEKKELLENRDKILRKYRVKVNDVNQAAVFQGTCPDMCPEIERYRREVQKLLHPYEVIPSSHGAVDHYRAVKDYSRSAADQEEPLPHELRPVEVLERTMIYLIDKIPFDENQLQIWYDFLWNRTRSIRKDITQQMLHDTSAVSLIEKCVRFHIFAAYKLCELDIGDFNQKMNSENLTKCLLSLRHMYDDLNKADVSCSNESEFRCYDVLLNLNDSNILRQILTYKQSVRQSSEIRFALKLFSAMQNSNYVVFFRLIRDKATFLQACLSHRYFNRVRTDALKILTKSYSAVGPAHFPVVDLAKWLNFEKPDEVITFCQLFGLSSTADDSVIVTNRSSFSEPDQDIDLKLSRNIIEGKLRCSLGELFNGGSVPPVSFPPPVISFDAYNRYVNDAVVQTFFDSVKEDNFNEKQPSLAVDFRPQATPKVQPTINESLITNLANDILLNESGEIVRHITLELFQRSISSHILSKFTGEIIGSLVRNVYNEQTDIAKATARRKAEIRLEFDRICDEFRSDLLNNVCQSLIGEIAKKEFAEAKTVYVRKVQKHVDSLSLILRDEFIDRFVSNETVSYCTSFYETEITDRLNALERIKTNLMLMNVRKCFKHWLKKMRRTKHTLKLLNEFPVFPGRLSIDGSTPPKKFRLVGYEDCPTPDCCRPAIAKAKHEAEAVNNGVFELVNKIMSDERKREMDESAQEIRILLEKLKRGIREEKSVLADARNETP